MSGLQATFRPIAIGSRRDLEDVGRVVQLHGIRPVIDRFVRCAPRFL
jgi:hypothetical protein